MVDTTTLFVATRITGKIFDSFGGDEDRLIEEGDHLSGVFGGGLKGESLGKVLLGSKEIVLDGLGDLGGRNTGIWYVVCGIWYRTGRGFFGLEEDETAERNKTEPRDRKDGNDGIFWLG